MEAGSFGSRVLGMPGPMGTPGAGSCVWRSTGSEAGGGNDPAGITREGDKICLIINKGKRRLMT